MSLLQGMNSATCMFVTFVEALAIRIIWRQPLDCLSSAADYGESLKRMLLKLWIDLRLKSLVTIDTRHSMQTLLQGSPSGSIIMLEQQQLCW